MIEGETGILVNSDSSVSGGIVYNYIENTGTITGNGGVAIDGVTDIGLIGGAAIDGVETVNNQGIITGDVNLGAGDDTFVLSGASSLLAGSVNTGDGADTVTLNDGSITVNIDAGAGDDVINLNSGDVFHVQGGDGKDAITLAGSIVTSASTIVGGAGDDTLVWSSGTTPSINGDIGSDTLSITASEYDGSQLLDGGDDTSSADGWIDALTLGGLTVTSNSASVVNWETVIVDGGQLTISDGLLMVGSDTGTGLTIAGGGLFDGLDAFALTGNLTVDMVLPLKHRLWSGRLYN